MKKTMKVNEETERMNPQVEDEHSAQLVLQHLCCLLLSPVGGRET